MTADLIDLVTEAWNDTGSRVEVTRRVRAAAPDVSLRLILATIDHVRRTGG